MLLLLMLLNAPNGLGIGIGQYPNGDISFKFNSGSPMVMQLTVGPSFWNWGGVGWGGSWAVGGRALFEMGKGGQGVEYVYFLGAGAGVHFNTGWVSGIGILGEGFGELEIFPNPRDLPLSVEIGIGLAICPTTTNLWIGPFIPFGIHFYLGK
ncbi:MAG: hypothetical protein PHX21_08120 [bacterium]|nr:hypothetical protein [bacterium]